MEKTEFLTIFPTFENLEIVKKTLPSVIAETKKNNAKLIVHDSSIKGKQEKWNYLQKLNENDDFFLLLSDNLSMAHARNMCLSLGQELYAPDYICMTEDDHGFEEGLILQLVNAMKKYYGKDAPNGLKFGLFSGCTKHFHGEKFLITEDGNVCPDDESNPMTLGGANSCFRCAPTSHWNTVLKGYDTDEYLISTFQTKNLNFRNYHKGFTTLFVQNGKYTFAIDAMGRGASINSELKMWDEKYTASDKRSKFIGKKEEKEIFPQKVTKIDKKINLPKRISGKIKKTKEKIMKSIKKNV